MIIMETTRNTMETTMGTIMEDFENHITLTIIVAMLNHVFIIVGPHLLMPKLAMTVQRTQEEGD